MQTFTTAYTTLEVLKNPKGLKITNKYIKNNRINSANKSYSSKNRKSASPGLAKKKNQMYESYTCASIIVPSRSRSSAMNSKYFTIDDKPSDEVYQKAKKRQPTPVAAIEKIIKLQEPKPNYLSMSAKERINSYSSDQKLPRFASDNPSCRSHYSDHVESHPLTEFNDDLEDNLENILMSIKHQNDDLRNKIQSKRVDQSDMTSTMDLVNNYKIVGVPLDVFRTPEISKMKTKTTTADMHYPINNRNMTNTVDVHKFIRMSQFESEDADFERDDNSEIQNHLNVPGVIKKSEQSTVVPHRDEDKGVTCSECTLLKS
jgi:hypothetical protein